MTLITAHYRLVQTEHVWINGNTRTHTNTHTYTHTHTHTHTDTHTHTRGLLSREMHKPKTSPTKSNTHSLNSSHTHETSLTYPYAPYWGRDLPPAVNGGPPVD